MNAAKAARAAALLRQARAEGVALACLPADCRPSDAAEGYAIQQAFVDASPGRPAGYKIGATSARAQDFLQTDGPFYGRVLASDLHDSPASFDPRSYLFCLIEPEFAFRIGRTLESRPRPFEDAEIAEAVTAVMPAIEVVTSAFSQWQDQGAPSLIADNGVDGALVLGSSHRNWRDLDLARHRVTLTINGEFKGEGRGKNALGHPLTALTWLVNKLSSQRLSLDAGQIVTTGVVTPFELAAPGDRIVADFGLLGQVETGFPLAGA